MGLEPPDQCGRYRVSTNQTQRLDCPSARTTITTRRPATSRAAPWPPATRRCCKLHPKGRMKRRDAIFLLCNAALAWPLLIRAQQLGKIPRIGFLAAVPLATLAPRIQAFRRGLRELGYGPARSHLCGQDPQGNETRRAAGRAADEVRAGHQSQDLQGARPNDSTIAVATRGRGDPMTARCRVFPTAVQGDLIL